MATRDPQQRSHLFPPNTRSIAGYTAHGSGGGSDTGVPPLERQKHAQNLRTDFGLVEAIEQQRVAQQVAAGIRTAIGIQIEFEGQPGIALAAASLARDNQGIELLNVRARGNQVFATVLVPPGKLQHFENLINDYATHRTTQAGQARDHQTLIDAIRSVRVATFDALWTDTADALPADDAEAIWWEAWLPTGSRHVHALADFRNMAEPAGLIVRERVLRFPERVVIVMHGSKAQLLQSALVLAMVAELRRAKTTAEFFSSLPLDQQADWANDLQGRLLAQHAGNSYVTLLDTGVNHGHPLLVPFVDGNDRHCIEPAWGPDDANGHGTELAGLALLGDLTAALSEDGPLTVSHRLESVRILRGHGDNEGESYGAITAEAVARVEITDPQR